MDDAAIEDPADEAAADVAAEVSAALLAAADDAAAVVGEVELAAGAASDPHAANAPNPTTESPAARKNPRRFSEFDGLCGRMSGLIIISRFRLCFHQRMRET